MGKWFLIDYTFSEISTVPAQVKHRQILGAKTCIQQVCVNVQTGEVLPSIPSAIQESVACNTKDASKAVTRIFQIPRSTQTTPLGTYCNTGPFCLSSTGVFSVSPRLTVSHDMTQRHVTVATNQNAFGFVYFHDFVKKKTKKKTFKNWKTKPVGKKILRT